VLTRALADLPVADLIGLGALLFAGGIVKGVLGIGVPLILVPIMVQFLALPAAVGLLTMPMVAANLRQALEGGPTLPAVRRLSPIISTLAPGALIGAHLLVSIDRRLLDAIVGASFVLLAALLLCLPRVRLGGGAERWVGPPVGLLAGLLGGMSAMFGPPLVLYQVGLGVTPPVFVKHMAILALTGTTMLLVTFGASGAMSPRDLAVSGIAVLPIQLGMPFGRRLRGRVPPVWFRAVVLCVLAGAGLGLLRRAFL